MDYLDDYYDPMDTSEDNQYSQNQMQLGQRSSSVSNSNSQEDSENQILDLSFRCNSWFFATFPWSSPLPIFPTILTGQLGDEPTDHYGFVRHFFLKSKARKRIKAVD